MLLLITLVLVSFGIVIGAKGTIGFVPTLVYSMAESRSTVPSVPMIQGVCVYCGDVAFPLYKCCDDCGLYYCLACFTFSA